MKVKNILIKGEINGMGLVNYDSTDQRKMLWKTPIYSKHNNVSYSKKVFTKVGNYVDEDGELKPRYEYKHKISSNCLKSGIYERDCVATSPSIAAHPVIMYGAIASPLSLLRGYMIETQHNGMIKKKGCVTITDAIQTCSASSWLETMTRKGEKKTEKKGEGKEDSGTTFFKRETVGDISYAFKGNIDIESLRFISSDNIFDRLAFNSDEYDYFLAAIKNHYPEFDSEIGYYLKKGSVVEIPEQGIELSSDITVKLVRELLLRILSLHIKRNTSYAKMGSLQIKLVYNPLKDTMEDDNNWITLGSEEDISNVDFDPETFMVLGDYEEMVARREGIEKFHREMDKKKKKNKEKTTK